MQIKGSQLAEVMTTASSDAIDLISVSSSVIVLSYMVYKLIIA
jgi:hypothetical protein